MKLNLIHVIYKIMKIPQCFLSPVFSTSSWQLPSQKENPSGSLATRIVSLVLIVVSAIPPSFSDTEGELYLSFQRKADLYR